MALASTVPGGEAQCAKARESHKLRWRGCVRAVHRERTMSAGSLAVSAGAPIVSAGAERGGLTSLAEASIGIPRSNC